MSIVRKIREREREFACQPAVIGADRTWSYAELYERVDRLSNALLDLGLGKGDVLLCWLPNVREALECELACLQVGAIWVTLNAGLTWPEVEAVHHSTDPAVFVTTSELAARIHPSNSETEEQLGESALVSLDEVGDAARLFGSSHDFEDAVSAGSVKRPEIEIDESDIARLRYTSGTTGEAKAAILSHRAYLASLRNLQEQLHPLDSSDRVLHAAPLTHASAAMAYPILDAGGANVIMPHFDAEAVLEAIETHRITTMFAVPTMLQRLAAAASFAARDLSSLRTVSYGGAAMPVDKLEPLLEKMGPVFMQIYGLTEALHPVTCLQREEHFAGNPRLGSVGKVTSICELRVAGEDGLEMAPGEVGEFFVRGPIVFDGYWRNPEETAKVLADGWVATGDLGYRDEDGYCWIVDRKKDVIISGGFNVYSKEVEMRLNGHPEVAEAALIGLPHEDWGEVVHAVVHLHDGAVLSEEDLIAYCREALAGYKTPKGITFCDTALPKNSAGKILKSEVKRMAGSLRIKGG